MISNLWPAGLRSLLDKSAKMYVFSGSLESHRLSKLSTNPHGAFRSCTVHFDFLKFDHPSVKFINL